MPHKQTLPPWTIDTHDVLAFTAAWTTWIESIAGAYFGERARAVAHRSVVIEGLALGIAWLLLEAERGAPVRGRRTVRRANRRGEFGAGAGLHESTREGLANAAFAFARGVVKDKLGARVPAVAAITLAVAAMRAVGQASGDATPAAARELFRIELAECAGAQTVQALLRRVGEEP